MTHLAPEEFVDLLDGVLAPARAAHAESCADCRAQAAAMRATLREAAAIDVPEPPPVFWESFGARTRDAVPAGGWRGRFASPWIGAAAAALVVLAVLTGAKLTREPAPPVQKASAPAATAAERIDDAIDAPNTDAWDIVVAAAADMAFEEAQDAGMAPHPGAIDRAVQGMTKDELVALAQLLQSELKGAGD